MSKNILENEAASKNKHIEDYLTDSFCSDEKEFPFAVLLKGDWGSGKTHFIKNYIENHENSEKFIHISLYGLQKTSEIEENIFSLKK